MPSQALIRKALVFAGCLLVPSVVRADHGLTPQPIEFASVGPLAFTPDGILLAGDPQAATVFAIDLEESAEPPKAGYDLPNIVFVNIAQDSQTIHPNQGNGIQQRYQLIPSLPSK